MRIRKDSTQEMAQNADAQRCPRCDSRTAFVYEGESNDESDEPTVACWYCAGCQVCVDIVHPQPPYRPMLGYVGTIGDYPW